MRLLPVFAAMLWAVLISGCSLDSRFTSASMRIDVDVYRGPLSKDAHGQWGELYAAVVDAERALDILDGLAIRETKAVPSKNSAYRTKEDDYRWNKSTELLNKLSGEVKEVVALVGNLRVKLCAPGGDVSQRFGCLAYQVSDAGGGPPEAVLAEAVELATHFQARAFYWAESQLAAPLQKDVPAHRVLIDLINFYGSYGSQISARADAIMQQLRGIDREHLPLSVHLRETAPPDTLQLYKWYGAIAKERDADAAIRTIERLYADFNWARINTVYASGQGDVAMAFIKDEIGNWNLKSFDNDPTELLQHYTELTRVVVKGAADVAKATLAPGSNFGTALLQQSLEAAGRVTSGRLGGGSAAEIANVQALRERFLAKLAVFGEATKATGVAIAAERAEAETAQQKANADANSIEAAIETNKAALAAAPNRKKADIEGEVQMRGKAVETRVANFFASNQEVIATNPLLAPAVADANEARGRVSEANLALAAITDANAETQQAGFAVAAIKHAELRIDLAEKRAAALQQAAKLVAIKAKAAKHAADTKAALRRLLDDQEAVLDALQVIVVPPKATAAATAAGVVPAAASAAATGLSAAGL